MKSPGAANALVACTPPMATIVTSETTAAAQRLMALPRTLDRDVVVVVSDVGRLADGDMGRR